MTEVQRFENSTALTVSECRVTENYSAAVVVVVVVVALQLYY